MTGSDTAALALLSELNLGSAKGGRNLPSPLAVSVVRALTEKDLPTLLEPEPLNSKSPGLVKIRHSHHQLAQVLARGADQKEASLITGYTPVYISVLQDDPAFEELLAHYRQEREAVFIDVLERMKVLGLSSLEMLQEKLEDSDIVWTKRELMEMAELMLLKPQQNRGNGFGGGSATPAVSVNVKFVTAQVPERTESSIPVVDAVDLLWKDVS